MRPSLTVGCALLVTACASAPPPSASDPEALRQMEQALPKRNALVQRLESTEPSIRERCELTDGDCMLEVRDARKDLVYGRVFPNCVKLAAGEARDACEERTVAEQGRAQKVADYYEMHSWCIKRQLECVARLEEEAAKSSVQQRHDQRKQAIESSAEAAALQVAVDAAGAKVEFIRSTLPPRGEDLCLELPKGPACLQQVQQQLEAYEAELGKDEGSYAEAAAAQLYAKAKQAEESCYEPEIKCLMEAAKQFGGTAQTREKLTKNLDQVQERQQLLTRVAPAAAGGCVRRGVAKHQARVVELYRQYARRPITYFRLQLLREFSRLHKTQLECLQARVKK